MEIAPASIPEQERQNSHGTYERLQIKQAGGVHREVEIVNYISATQTSCDNDVRPKLDMSGNTIAITSGSEWASVDFSERTVRQSATSN